MDRDRRRTLLPVEDALLIAAVGTAVVDGVLRVARLGTTRIPEVRPWHLAFAGGHTVALAFVVATAVAILALTRRAHRLVPAVVAIGATFPFALAVFHEDTEVFPRWAQLAFAGGVAIVFGSTLLVLSAPRRWYVRGAAGVAGTAALVANHFVLYVYYPGTHLTLVLIGIAGLGIALHGARVPPWTRRVGAPVAGVLALWASASLVLKPDPRVAVALANDESAVVEAMHLFGREDRPRISFAGVPPASFDWFLPRQGRRAVAPSPRRLATPRPIVVLVTIDAFRRDAFFDPARAERLPNLAALAAEGAVFTDARSTASSTSPAIASLFTGKLYSQRYWSPVRLGNADRPFLTEDTAVRFPELLARRAVPSGSFPSTIGLLQQYGITRGFTHEVPYGDARTMPTPALVDALLAWLPRDGRSAFAWIHLLDAHAPYNLGGPEGTAKERYLRELTVADAAIGKLRAGIEKLGVADRTLFVVTSDHGEAFGEHGANTHGKNVYEESIRVPLLVTGPGVAPDSFDVPVSLLDLGPTILDVFGVATPGDFLGESLLPILRGEPRALTRPIAFDHAKGQQGLVFADGLKVVCWRTTNPCEIYDLARDPGEEDNVFGEHAETARRVGAVNAYFEAHRLKRPGYVLPTR